MSTIVVYVILTANDYAHCLYLLTNKTDRHDITEIFLKVPLNTINQDQTNYRAKNRFNAITGA
jgi:hypothetical protein